MASERWQPIRLSVLARNRRTASPTQLQVFNARCEARAVLYAGGHLDLHEAVDLLQADAVRLGLPDQFGQDKVQQILSRAFAGARIMCPPCGADPCVNQSFCALCRKTDSQRSADQRLKQHPRTALEPDGLAVSTIITAEFLVQQGDSERLRAWLANQSPDERAAIRLHFSHKREKKSG